MILEPINNGKPNRLFVVRLCVQGRDKVLARLWQQFLPGELVGVELRAVAFIPLNETGSEVYMRRRVVRKIRRRADGKRMLSSEIDRKPPYEPVGHKLSAQLLLKFSYRKPPFFRCAQPPCKEPHRRPPSGRRRAGALEVFHDRIGRAVPYKRLERVNRLR